MLYYLGRGRRIMANIRAFQACDESSILSARTTDDPLETSELFWRFFVTINL